MGLWELKNYSYISVIFDFLLEIELHYSYITAIFRINYVMIKNGGGGKFREVPDTLKF